MGINYNVKLNVFVSVVNFGVSIAVTAFVFKIILTFGGLSTLGLWSALSAWMYFIRLGDVGMNIAVVRFIAQCDSANDSQKIRSYLDTSIILNCALFTRLALAAYCVFYLNLNTFMPTTPLASEMMANKFTARQILPVMIFGFILSNISTTIQGALTGLHQGYKATTLTTGGLVVQFFGVLLFFKTSGLLAVAWGQVAQHLFIIFIGWIITFLELSRSSQNSLSIFPRYFSFPALQEMFAFSLKSQLATIINGLLEPVSKMLVGHASGLSMLGIYELSFKLVSLPRNAVVAGAHATTPALTGLIGEDIVAAQKLYKSVQRNLMVNGSIVLLTSVLAAPVLSWFWLGSINLQMWVMTTILATGFFANLAAAPSYIAGIASGRLLGNIIGSFCALSSMCVFFLLTLGYDRPFLSIIGVGFGLGVGSTVVLKLNRRFWT